MVPVTVTAFIAAPREEVFRYLGDLASRPSFTDHYMKDLRLSRTRSYGEGASARFRLAVPFASEWVEVTITRFEWPRLIFEKGRAGRLGRATLSSVFELAVHGEGVTRVDLTTWAEDGTPLDSLKDALFRRRFLRRKGRVALERLRRILEEPSGAALPRATVAGYEPLKRARFGG